MWVVCATDAFHLEPVMTSRATYLYLTNYKALTIVSVFSSLSSHPLTLPTPFLAKWSASSLIQSIFLQLALVACCSSGSTIRLRSTDHLVWR